MRLKRYKPADDPVVQALKKARTEKQRIAIEKKAILETDNGRRPTDPKGKVSQAKKPRLPKKPQT